MVGTLQGGLCLAQFSAVPYNHRLSQPAPSFFLPAAGARGKLLAEAFHLVAFLAREAALRRTKPRPAARAGAVPGAGHEEGEARQGERDGGEEAEPGVVRSSVSC